MAEEGALAAEAGIVLSRVMALVPLRGSREILDAAGKDRVVVRAEEAVALEVEGEAAGGLPEERQERAAILVVHEEHRLVDGVRRDVKAAVWELGAEDSRYGVEASPALASRPLTPTFRRRSGTFP